MAVTTVASANQAQAFRAKFFMEYVRDSLFFPYMGEDENSVIQIVEELGEKAGKTVNVPLVTRLAASGITGDDTLEGNEEALGNYNHAINIDQVRNAVVVGKMEQQSTEIDIMKAARSMLKLWIMDDLRDAILTALGSANVDGATAYASCSEAQKDTWLAAQYVSATNSHVLFGALASNASSEDHSTSLANVDSTNDKLLFDQLQFAKRLAKKADRHIRPIKLKGGREWFVMFCESYGFRDLKVDTETIHQNGQVRGDDNPLFQDPDLMLDGVICREIPEIAVITGVGASSIDVGPNYFCGAQAIGLAWAQRSEFVVDPNQDYKNKKGVAVSEIRGVEKLTYNNIQNGVLTVYSSGVADS